MFKALKGTYLLLTLGVILIGILLRFYGFADWSLHNDELSTLFRSQYPSVNEVIEKGVITDVHPAFSEVFIHYWTTIFGDSPFWLRLPYLLFSCAALFFFFAFAKLWTNTKAAILATSVISVSYLFILYSQIARPYAIGFFVINAFSYYWFYGLIKQVNLKQTIAAILLGSLGLYVHYFLGLSIALLMLLSLPLVTFKRQKLLYYFGVGFGIIILFLPHLSITLGHLAQKGVGWLPAPEHDFIWKFFNFSFNQSLVFQLLLLSIPLLALVAKAFSFKFRNLILFSLFALTYGIGYYYSIKISPVLQFSVLIYALPFLILFSFSFISEKFPSKFFYALLILILGLGIYTLIVESSFYQKKPFADFKKVSQALKEWEAEYPDLRAIGNTNSPKYFDYYFKQLEIQPEIAIPSFDHPSRIAEAKALIDSTFSTNLALYFANVALPLEIYEYAKTKFPSILEKRRFFNSEALLLSKKLNQRETLFKSFAYKEHEAWSIDPALIINDSSSQIATYHIQSTNEYALTYRDTIKNLFSEQQRWLTLSADLKGSDREYIKLVVSIDRAGNNIHWRGFDIKNGSDSVSWIPIVEVFALPEEVQMEDEITIYWWNPEKSNFYLRNFFLANYMDSDYHFYKFDF